MQVISNISIGLLILLFGIAMSACGVGRGIKGEGPVVSEERSLPNFNAIQNRVNAAVFLKQGPQEAVLIEGQANILSNLETEVRSGKLEIAFKENVSQHEGIKIYITTPEYRELGLSGSGSYRSEHLLRGESLAIRISGSGDVNLQAEYEHLQTSISGSGDVELRGGGQILGVKVSGSGGIHAREYEVEEADVRISGSGNCELNVRDKLAVAVSGSGNVRYKGRPEISSSVSGSGGLAHLD